MSAPSLSAPLATEPSGSAAPVPFLHAVEGASRAEIQALQRERLARTLHHVYENVPFYRAKFDAAGVHPR